MGGRQREEKWRGEKVALKVSKEFQILGALYWLKQSREPIKRTEKPKTENENCRQVCELSHSRATAMENCPTCGLAFHNMGLVRRHELMMHPMRSERDVPSSQVSRTDLGSDDAGPTMDDDQMDEGGFGSMSEDEVDGVPDEPDRDDDGEDGAEEERDGRELSLKGAVALYAYQAGTPRVDLENLLRIIDYFCPGKVPCKAATLNRDIDRLKVPANEDAYRLVSEEVPVGGVTYEVPPCSISLKSFLTQPHFLFYFLQVMCRPLQSCMDELIARFDADLEHSCTGMARAFTRSSGRPGGGRRLSKAWTLTSAFSRSTCFLTRRQPPAIERLSRTPCMLRSATSPLPKGATCNATLLCRSCFVLEKHPLPGVYSPISPL